LILIRFKVGAFLRHSVYHRHTCKHMQSNSVMTILLCKNSWSSDRNSFAHVWQPINSCFRTKHGYEISTGQRPYRSILLLRTDKSTNCTAQLAALWGAVVTSLTATSRIIYCRWPCLVINT